MGTFGAASVYGATRDAGATLIALGVVTVALVGAPFLFVWWLLRRRPKPMPPALSFFDVIGRRSEPGEAE